MEQNKINEITKESLLNEVLSIEKKLSEAIDKSKNPIQANPTNENDQILRVGQKNVPEDKEPSDSVKKKVYNELAELVSLLEKKIYTKDSDSIPAGSNITSGPAGGKMYEEPHSGDNEAGGTHSGLKPAVIYK